MSQPERSNRARVLGEVAAVVCAGDLGHPTRVAVDGVTSSGKSTFARELLAEVAKLGRPAIHISMDGFHNPREHRHRRGRMSAELTGAFYNAPRSCTCGTSGSSSTPIWRSRTRGTHRDAELLGDLARAQEIYDARYQPAARRYLEAADPLRHATIVLDNNDFSALKLRAPSSARSHRTPIARVALLGDRCLDFVTHRELDSVLDVLPTGVDAAWLATDDRGARHLDDIDGLWVVSGSPYRDNDAAREHARAGQSPSAGGGLR
jgi:uridine kinase